MVVAVEGAAQLPALLAAPRAIVLVSVPWSPWPRKSRDALAALEASREQWSPNAPVAFFALWPEGEDALNRWYEGLCEQYSPRFELHGHGYGPLWWVAGGAVL